MVKFIFFVVSMVVYVFASTFIIGAGTFTPYECFSIAMSFMLSVVFVMISAASLLVLTVLIAHGEKA